MERVLTDVIPNRAVYVNPAKPHDIGLNIAVRHLATTCCPSGWDQVKTFEEAPTTLEGIVAYAKEHGRLCIAEEDSDGTIYDCADTNHHLRAWHDSIHFRHRFAFNAAGEAAATYVQVAQLGRVYGYSEKVVGWGALLLADILGLVHFHQRTGKWPKNKRQGTIKESRKWVDEARLILLNCQGADHERLAAERASSKWGYPYEAPASVS